MWFTVVTRGCLYEPEYTEELLQMEAEQAERNRGIICGNCISLMLFGKLFHVVFNAVFPDSGVTVWSGPVC